MNNGTQIAGSRNDKASRIIVYVILIIWALLCIFPVYWMLTFSLKTNAEIFGENVVGLPREWVWENYSRAFHTGNMPRYFLNSLILSSYNYFFKTSFFTYFSIYSSKNYSIKF